jgi:hypothetical protein
MPPSRVPWATEIIAVFPVTVLGITPAGIEIANSAHLMPSVPGLNQIQYVKGIKPPGGGRVIEHTECPASMYRPMYPSGGRAFADAARRRRPKQRTIAFFIVVTPPKVALSLTIVRSIPYSFRKRLSSQSLLVLPTTSLPGPGGWMKPLGPSSH